MKQRVELASLKPGANREPLSRTCEVSRHPWAFRTAPPAPAQFSMAGWRPLVDIVEDEKEFLVKADLPDLRRHDVGVTIDNGILTISGERRMRTEEEAATIHPVEISGGGFRRSFGLPEGVDPRKVRAEFKDGVLVIELPKTGKPKPGTFDVKVI